MNCIDSKKEEKENVALFRHEGSTGRLKSRVALASDVG